MLDCLIELVGLSDNDCNCHEDDRPSGYNTSESGYYLTDLEDGVQVLDSILAASDCGTGSIWDTMAKARSLAILDFETDLFAAIYKNHAARFATYSGDIGQRKFSSYLSGKDGQFTGIRVQSRMWRGTKLTISHIAINTDFSGDIAVSIYSSNDFTTPLNTYTITGIANSWVNYELPTPVTYDLWDESCDELEYYIVYDSSAIKPANNKFTCCGRRLNWLQYADLNGISTNDLEQITTATNQAMGLSLTGSLICDGGEWLCNLDELGDYNAKSVIAKTIQFKGAVKLISAILDSGNVNYYTLLNREALYGKRNHFNKRYYENINWIAENIPSYVTDCYKCSDKRIKKTSILI